ncbi:MAG TPA: lipocalin family protein [Pyrinomonadaceae bacterium]|jgi:hypothetical protein|nr:lipocalin family protein [Pyrinomonadaceae bacterium]
MKASRRINYKLVVGMLVVQAACFFVPQPVFCQRESLDIIEYTPPRGWTKTPKDGLIVYSTIDKVTGGYCLLTVYPSSSSAGSPQKDFAASWSERVAAPFKADSDPKPQSHTEHGWTSLSAATQIISDGTPSAVMMTVVSGYGRSASILVILSNQEFMPQIEAFMGGIKMNEATAMAYAKPPPTAPASNAAPIPNSYDPAALVGRWGNGIAGDTISGSYITYGSNASQQFYIFNADGTFRFVYSGYSGLAGQMGSFHITTEESGVYSIKGDSITITPKKSQSNSNSGGVTSNALETVTYRWTIHYFEGSKEYELILHPDHQTQRDGGFSYGCLAFPNSYCYPQIKK